MTTTDRRDATDAQFADELARLDRLDVADEDTVKRLARDISGHYAARMVSYWDGDIPRTRHVCACGDQYAALAEHLAAKVLDALKPAPGTEAAPCAEHGHLYCCVGGHAPGTDTSGQAADELVQLTEDMGLYDDTSTEDALHRVLDLADQWESDAARADDAEPATRDDLSRMISASRWSRQHAAEVRDAIAGPQRDHDKEGLVMGLRINPGGASWAYSGFMCFRERLAEAEGLVLRDMVGFGGERPWEFTSGNPITTLAPLLKHSDCEGYLDPWECEEVLPRLRFIVESWGGLDDYDKRQATALIAGMEHCAEHRCALVFS